MSSLSERIREVEDVALLTADIRRKKLGQQKYAHQRVPDGTENPPVVPSQPADLRQ
jgi:hypothetical protein